MQCIYFALTSYKWIKNLTCNSFLFSWGVSNGKQRDYINRIRCINKLSKLKKELQFRIIIMKILMDLKCINKTIWHIIYQLKFFLFHQDEDCPFGWCIRGTCQDTGLILKKYISYTNFIFLFASTVHLFQSSQFKVSHYIETYTF